MKVYAYISKKPVSLHPLSNKRGSFRDVAQLVAHLVWDQRVARSSRVIPTKKRGANE